MTNYDYRKLKGRIVEMFDYQSTFAKKMGMSKNQLSTKLTNKVAFTVPELERAIGILELKAEEVPEFFMKHKEVQ